MLQEASEQLATLGAKFTNLKSVLRPDELEAQKNQLENQAADPTLWDDPARAQKLTSTLAALQTQLKKISALNDELEDAQTLLELATLSVDPREIKELEEELHAQLAALTPKIEALEIQTLLNGPYDQRHAVLSIRSGAGGVDAADFAQMLLRMYLRWAEKHGYDVQILDTSYAEEAGIKSATIQIDAPYAYGTLSVEAGTHRLVRQSPFDNAQRRQTSFAAVEVIPLIETTDHIEIPESELKIDVFRSSGPGGQSVNTTDSAVRLTHLPTGLVVSMQNEKSQLQNKAAALRVLQSRLLQLKREAEAAQKRELAGDVKASWGDQMRSYVLHPYKMVKDLRTLHESNQPEAVLDGDLDPFLDAAIRWRKAQTASS